MVSCEGGACGVECGGRGRGCACISWGETHEDCFCRCYPSQFAIVNERKIPFKRFKPGIKITSQTKFNICTHGLPIVGLAELLEFMKLKYISSSFIVCSCFNVAI